MRIGIDARELCGRPTGVGRYLKGLLVGWSGDDRARQHDFVLYAPELVSVPLDAHRFRTRIVPGPPGTLWEQIRMPAAAAKDHLDVLFAPGYTAPLLSGVPTIVAIHDVSFAAHPEWFTVREGARRRWLTRRAATGARAVITISDFSRGELIDRLGVPETKIHVVPPGITALMRGDDGSAALSGGEAVRPPAARPPAVLYVGSIFNRRHIPDLIRAFAPIARAHCDASLDIVGDNRSVPHQDVSAVIAAEKLANQVRWRRYVPDVELVRLYASARAFAFLSEYEGLGLTPLEALASGVPPLLLDTPVARESCGRAALYVRAGDPRSTTRALDQLLFDRSVREQILEAAPAVLAKYDWAKAARDTLTVIEHCTC